MEQIHVRPHLTHAKPGGMMDAIKHDRFIEYLADKWPERKIDIPVIDKSCEHYEEVNNFNEKGYPFK